jgi:hypothetical protein
MFQKFWSKAQMRLYLPLEKFEPWPEDTFSFCPKCALDSFELLLDSGCESYVRCQVCGSLWIVRSLAKCDLPVEAALA